MAAKESGKFIRVAVNEAGAGFCVIGFDLRPGAGARGAGLEVVADCFFSCEFQLRFNPEAASARWNQGAGAVATGTESSSFEACIFAGSVTVPIIPTMLPG